MHNIEELTGGDIKKYIIGEGKKYKIWNNGYISEIAYSDQIINDFQPYSDRVYFLNSLLISCKIGQFYKLRNWSYGNIARKGSVIPYEHTEGEKESSSVFRFYGLSREYFSKCFECNSGPIELIDSLFICSSCKHISGFEVNDD